MSKKIRAARSAAVVGAAIILAGVVVAKDKVVTLAEVPEAVKATISQKAAGATPSKIELEDEDGKQLYSVKFMQGDKEREIEIATDGTFIKEDVEEAEKDDDDDKATTGTKKGEKEDDEEEDAVAPDAVKKALEPILKGAPIKKLSKETEDGAVQYEAEYEVNGKPHSANVAADGTVKELESPVAVDAIPAVVSAAIKAAHPTATIKSADEAIENPGAGEKHFFEVKIEEAGKTSEVKLDATGKMVSAEEHEGKEEKGEKGEEKEKD